MIKKTRDTFLLTGSNTDSVIAEAFRSVRTNLIYFGLDRGKQVFVVTSAAPAEGKTSLLINLGIMLAQDSKKVLLVDGDLRRPNLHYLFRTGNRTGLSSIMMGTHSLAEAITSTEIESLFLLPAGPVHPSASELLGSLRYSTMMEQSRDLFDVILIDAPAILSVSDANLLARPSDGVLLVVRSNKTREDQVLNARKKLQPVADKLLGVILNDHMTESYS